MRSPEVHEVGGARELERDEEPLARLQDGAHAERGERGVHEDAEAHAERRAHAGETALRERARDDVDHVLPRRDDERERGDDVEAQ